MILISDPSQVKIEVGSSTDQDQDEVVFSIMPIVLPEGNKEEF